MPYKDKQQMKIQHKRWLNKNPKYMLNYHHNWRMNNKASIKESRLKYKSKLKEDIFNILGGKRCVRCGFTDERALQIDHINGRGNAERKNFNRPAVMRAYYRQHPEEAKKKLQVLCANCNWIKRDEKHELN